MRTSELNAWKALKAGKALVSVWCALATLPAWATQNFQNHQVQWQVCLDVWYITLPSPGTHSLVSEASSEANSDQRMSQNLPRLRAPWGLQTDGQVSSVEPSVSLDTTLDKGVFWPHVPLNTLWSHTTKLLTLPLYEQFLLSASSHFTA